MVDLLTRPLLRRPAPTAGARLPWLAAAGAASWSVLAGLGLLGLPVLLVWLASGAEAPLGGPLRLAGQVWLAAHRVGVEVGGAWWQLAPWGLALVPLLLLYRAGRWAAHSSAVSGPWAAAELTAAVSVGYATLAAAVAGLVDRGAAVTVPAEAAVLAGLVAAAGAGTGIAAEAGLLGRLFVRVPPVLRPALRGGAVAVAALVAAGGLLVAVAALANAGRVAEVATALDPGLLGGALLGVLGASLVPNAAVWAASYAVGPGFAVGAGTAIAPGGVQVGMVPALPALGALPTSSGGAVAWAVLAVPVAAGVLSGVAVRRAAPDGPWWRLALHALGSGAVAGVVMAVLAGLSGGSLGTGRLAEVGPDQGWVALTSFAEVGAVAVLTALVLRWRRSNAT
ncbi:MAG TPA: DUF6350 family protein [Jiangellales bacterium]|nr:DUF6350 family protein [Jiangellales bacterium]